MRAIRIDAHGGPEVLGLVEIPDPVPGPGEVRVQVTHVGLNHLDLWVRRGVDSHAFPLPLIPGSDVAGIREDTGLPVVLHPGFGCGTCPRCAADRHDLCRSYKIRGETTDGGMCEHLVVPEAHLLPCPLPPDQAAALPLSLLTAWHMLVGRARIAPGQTVLIQAGASGVGSLAIQVAKYMGARVAATASTPQKRARCLELGAEAAWDYSELRSEAKRFERGGFDIVVDHVGAETWESSQRVLAWGGSYVTCGATSGHQVQLDLRAVFFKQLSILGATMGSMGEMNTAWAAVQAGAIVPVLDRVLPMSRLADAHALLEQRAIIGKVVVEQDL
jgi:NADPH:quinone reductase-like Zn-dependent oxidoreductase